MRKPMTRGAGAATAALVVAAAAWLPGVAQTPAPDQTGARKPCTYALVAMEDGVDSAHAKSGDVFRFVLVDTVTAPDGTVVPQGTRGYGVVANASHAGSGGRGGYLALETRFFALDDGKHVQAIIDRSTDQASMALGASGNAPGILGLIPIVGYAVGGYDAMHHGKDATIPRGTRMGVFIGDDAALGTCRPPKAGETPPPPPPTPTPAAATPSAAAQTAPPAASPGAPAAPPTPPAPVMSPTASPTMRPR